MADLTPEDIERIRRSPLTLAMFDVLPRWKAEGYDLDNPKFSRVEDVPRSAKTQEDT